MTKPPVKPRALLHRGTLDAAGFFLDIGLRSAAEARRRALALWTPGAVIYRVLEKQEGQEGRGLVVRLPRPVRVSARTAPGTPLVAVPGQSGQSGLSARTVLSAAPLLPDEIAALTLPASGAVVLVRGGVAVVETLTAANEEDPAHWIAVGDFAVATVTSLGTMPPPPVLTVTPATFDARSKLKGIPPAVPELAEVLKSLRSPAPLTGPLQYKKPAISLPGWLTGKFGAAGLPGAGGGGGPGTFGAAGASGEGHSLLFKLQRMAALLALRSDLANRIGRRQAQYMVRMMEMFERGDLEAALRHAIPLSDSSSAGDTLPSLGVPKPRTDLTLTALPGGGSTMGFGPVVFGDLQSLYRKAFERLERDGRIDEAAFVLINLLQASEEAVAFLEKHDRLRLAAEMAEARDLPPGLVVRQWFLAGDTERAVRIARQTGAFADAVVRLQKSRPDESKTLRTLWGQSLARAGDYAGAVEAVWPVPEVRQVAREWAQRTLDSGGVSGARMLARLLGLPETSQEEPLRTRALRLLGGEDPEEAAAREAFTNTLFAGPSTPETTAVARDAVRSVWRDLGTGARRIPPTDPNKWTRFAGDAALRADLPPLPKPAVRPLLCDSPDTITLRIEGGDTGTIPLRDAAFLPGGRTLIALGEAGVRLIARDGGTVVHIDAPAHRLVLSDTGNHALLLAPRGDLWTISRLDLATRRAAPWTTAALTAFAPDYDGSLWFVATGNAFVAIDAAAATATTDAGKFEALWRMPNVPGVIQVIARSKTSASFLTHDTRTTDDWGRPSEPTESGERWVYELPSLILRHRDPVPVPAELRNPLSGALPAPAPVLSATGITLSFAEAQRPSAEGPRFQYHSRDLSGRVASGFLPTGRPVLGLHTEPWSFVVTEEPTALTGRLILPSREHRALSVTLEGASKVAARLTGDTLTLADNRGRLLVFSLTDGTLLRNLRIS